jgi:uncharacterized protein YukE
MSRQVRTYDLQRKSPQESDLEIAMTDKIEDELLSIKVNFAEIHGNIKTVRELTDYNSDTLKDLSKQVNKLNESVAALGVKAESDTLKDLSKQVNRLNENVAELGVKANFNIFTSITGIVAIAVALFSITNTMLSRQRTSPDPVQMQAVFKHWQAQTEAQKPVVIDQWERWFPPQPEPKPPAAGSTQKPTGIQPSAILMGAPGWEQKGASSGR